MADSLRFFFIVLVGRDGCHFGCSTLFIAWPNQRLNSFSLEGVTLVFILEQSTFSTIDDRCQLHPKALAEETNDISSADAAHEFRPLLSLTGDQYEEIQCSLFWFFACSGRCKDLFEVILDHEAVCAAPAGMSAVLQGFL